MNSYYRKRTKMMKVKINRLKWVIGYVKIFLKKVPMTGWEPPEL